jgi:hypothetical protein
VRRVKRYGEAMADMKTLDELIKLQMAIQGLCQPSRADVAARNRLMASVKQFRTAKDKTGKLRYPKFSKLRVLMGHLMETSPALREMPDGQRKLRAAYLAAEAVSKRSYKGTSRKA